MTWYAYLMQCADGTLYAGSTTDVTRRLKEHNGEGAGKGAAYTRARRPVSVVYTKEFETRSEAAKHEAYVKSLTRAQKEALIVS